MKSGPLEVVQIDGLAVLKILKHCRESLPELVTGQLLGLDVEHRLEVTSCFPFPSRGSDDLDDQEGAEYQIDMMRSLRDVNVDNNTVGWYKATYMGSFLDESMIETQFNYQENIEKAVLIVYDPHRSAQGVLALRAFRMTQLFFNLYKKRDSFTAESLKKSNLTSDKVFVELPITVHNSALTQGLLYQLDDRMPDSFECRDLAMYPYIEKNLEFLLDCENELASENSKYQFYLRNVGRQQHQRQQFLMRRQQEQERRKEAGQEPLNDDDLRDNPLFKPIMAPSRLDTLLVTNQIAHYCGQVNQFANLATSNAFLVQDIQQRRL